MGSTIANSSARLCLFSCFTLLVTISPLQADTFRAALVAKAGITMSGSVLVDSFDSSDPSYSTNGDYTPYSRKAGGNVIATENEDGSLLTLQNNAFVYGKAFVGPNGAVLLGTNSSLGSITWINAGNVGIEPGWLGEHPGRFFLDLPAVPFTNGLSFPAKSTYMLMGMYYTSSYLLTSGNYQHTNFSLTSSEKLLVQGDVKVYFTGDLRMAGQSQIRIATNSSLTVYATSNIDLSGGGVINQTRFASNLTFYGLDTCNSIQYSGGSDLIGTFYAPNTAFKMSGGGNTIYNLVGSVVANSININGKYQIHLDESLPSFLIYPIGANLSSPVITENGEFQFEVTGLPGYQYAVQTSTNLTDWRSVAVNTSPFVYATNVAWFTPGNFFRAIRWQ